MGGCYLFLQTHGLGFFIDIWRLGSTDFSFGGFVVFLNF